ncbi:MAG TPA: RpiB/LacA/LacB family sugar-phosphate isomerase, partial [Stellaceae bacterium]|nr:RpiB/LacA/LacB family sugar-phosphate isomerase [Stellaceae bacterium]
MADLVAVAADHGGYELKCLLVPELRALGYEPLDLGPADTSPVDYPDYADKLAEAVSQGRAKFGVLICGTGIGMCIAANKLPGVRAAPCHDDLTAEMSRRHNDLNVLCLSAD